MAVRLCLRLVDWLVSCLAYFTYPFLFSFGGGTGSGQQQRGQDFRELAAHFEADYMEDMAKLGVRPPDVVTRVSEFIPEVRRSEDGTIQIDHTDHDLSFYSR